MANKSNYKFLMPNHIVVKDGLSCGDRVILLYDFEDGIMRFQIISEGCSCCNKICEWLQDRFNNRSQQEIVSECGVLIEKLNGSPEYIEKIIDVRYRKSREECYMAPIRILKDCAEDGIYTHGLSEGKVNLYVDKMDCDACAVRENISWLYDKPRHIHGQYKIPASHKELLMKLGKVTIKEIDTAAVRDMYDNLTEDDFEFMEEYKLLPMVYRNLQKLGILNKEDSRWRLLVYQRHRTVITYTEIMKLEEFIKENNLKVFFVKGAFTHKFYDDPMMRNLTDFDLLATNEEDAFTVIRWLLDNDFLIFPDSFSLKKVKQSDKNVYTGHLHFQKIINLQYRMIVDINFTGFPMIRVANYVPQILNDHITPESMIVVTLCHLFKHKEVFIKDINDLFLMLTSDELDSEILYEELKKNNLLNLFAITADFIIKEYNVPENAEEFFKLIDKIPNKPHYDNWPYSEDAVRRVKTAEFAEYAKDITENERIYLYPICIFDKIYDVNELMDKLKNSEFIGTEEKKISDRLIQLRIDNFYFIISPVGYFLEMKDYYNESMKGKIRDIVERILNIQEVNCMDIPYAVAFQEKWLDTEKE